MNRQDLKTKGALCTKEEPADNRDQFRRVFIQTSSELTLFPTNTTISVRTRLNVPVPVPLIHPAMSNADSLNPGRDAGETEEDRTSSAKRAESIRKAAETRAENKERERRDAERLSQETAGKSDSADCLCSKKLTIAVFQVVGRQSIVLMPKQVSEKFSTCLEHLKNTEY